MMNFDGARHAERRARVLDRLGDDAALVLAAAPELHTGLDAEVRYAPDAHVAWLTGYLEPEAVVGLCPSCGESPFTLFVRPRDAEREVWTGPRGGVEAAREVYGADAAYPMHELAERLPRLAGHVETLVARIESGRPAVDAVILSMMVAARRSRPRTGRGPRTLVDPAALLDPLRRVKDEAEIAALRDAARVTVEAFRDCFSRVRPGAGEWEIEAALEGGFRMRGATGPSFPTIVASGPNAATLHHTANDRMLRDGELVLIDAGARVKLYCADITRTVPVGGKYSPEQRDLVDAVRGAHDAAIAAARPGNTVEDLHALALRELTAGLVHLGFLSGPVDELIESGAFKPFYPHRTSHWLGLDVHDVGDYIEGGRPVPLVPGMVLTVEPGLYVPAGHAGGPASLRGTGVRVEDDVVVTADGPEVLTADLPNEPELLESLLS